MLTDDDKEEAQKHSTGGNGSGKFGLAESSDQGPGIHDHTDDQSPKGRTKCVSERVDGDSPGVDVQTHDEDVVQGESDETATSGRDQRESFDASAYLLEDQVETYAAVQAILLFPQSSYATSAMSLVECPGSYSVTRVMRSSQP
jgi:hypothetical protein